MKPIRLITAVAAAFAALTLAACSGSSKPTPVPAAATSPASAAVASPTPAGDPQTYDGAKAAVKRLDDAIARGDIGTAWDMLTSIGQSAMSKADYIYVANHCKHLIADETTISVSLNDANTIATVTSTAPEAQGGGTFTWNLVYEGGRWKHQPSNGAMDWMSQSRDKAMALLKSSGSC